MYFGGKAWSGMGVSDMRGWVGRSRRADGAGFDLIAPKLHSPMIRPGTVRRPTLIERLARDDSPPIVSVVAPADDGKTTLLTQWAEGDGRSFAWVSVDEPDNDPKRSYLPTSLQHSMRWNLLNPAGIVVLVTLSAEASSFAVSAAAVGVLVVVLALDVAVFRWAVQVSSKLDASRMLVTEKVFGFLLAALAVQLVLNGLSDVGIIHLTTGH